MGPGQECRFRMLETLQPVEAKDEWMSSTYADLCCLKPLEDFLHIQVIGKPILIYFSFLIAFLTFLHKSIKNALNLWNIA